MVPLRAVAQHHGAPCRGRTSWPRGLVVLPVTPTEMQAPDSGSDKVREAAAEEVPHADLRAHARALPADWPPLTSAQLVRLAALLRGS